MHAFHPVVSSMVFAAVPAGGGALVGSPEYDPDPLRAVEGG